jgi:hypothetical protein
MNAAVLRLETILRLRSLVGAALVGFSLSRNAGETRHHTPAPFLAPPDTHFMGQSCMPLCTGCGREEATPVAVTA